MRLGLLSDIHANPPALEAVLKCTLSAKRDGRSGYSTGMRFLFWASHWSKVCSAGFSARETSRFRAPQ